MAVPVNLADIHTLDDLIRAMETSGYSVKKEGEKSWRPALDEKYFRRMDKFKGDVGKFGSWLFDHEVALGSIDSDLGIAINSLLRETIPELSETVMNDHSAFHTQEK